jgi:hypothetical protein
MKRTLAIALAALASILAFGGGSAAADEGFGLKGLDSTFTGPSGSPAMQAGSHPFAWTTTFDVHTEDNPKLGEVPIEAIKDLTIELPPGLVGDPRATPRCSAVDFANVEAGLPACADSSVIGITTVKLVSEGKLDPSKGPELYKVPVYNLVPPPGAPAKFGFVALTVPVTLEAKVNPNPPYNLIASATNIAQPVRFYGSSFTIWGNPASPAHDINRGHCVSEIGSDTCPANIPERPLLTLPRRCDGPLRTIFNTDSWQHPGSWLPPYVIETHDDSVPPKPLGPTDCANLGFAPEISSQATTDRAESATGLDFHLDVEDEGLTNPTGRAQSDIKKAVVTLPEGVTVNPSAAEGLATCSESDLDRETLSSEPGDGCPQASKVGTVEVETPLLEGSLIRGEVFVADQNQNPFGSLLALYMVIKDPGLGILIKLPGRVEPNPRTGQLVTTFGEAPYELPQFPFSHFRFHFREGGRSVLVTPPRCGSFDSQAVFTPWANPSSTLTTGASLQINRGIGGGSCPAAGVPPFAPGFTAGSVNNDAGRYSPFHVRLTRRDGDQEMTRFSSLLPPGVTGKIAGVAKCPDADIEGAKSKSGRAEIASPSCPASSRIGSVLAGVGVGSELTYVRGQLYLAGPYKGAPLSVAAITPAVAGPFDIGTVVVREGLSLNPTTAAVEVNGAASDPIPHILAGIPLRLRDLRVHVDRENFTLNPTSCEPFSVRATLFGSFADPFSSADDVPVSLSDHYQATNCTRLGFKPRLSLKLKGGTRRGSYPALRAVVRPRRGDANIGKAVVTLPHSAFLEQAHIRTVCTRVQFAAKTCPKGSVYGRATAFTPLLDEPLKGPVYLRSSNHPLPDLVAALHGVVDINLVGRIDSVDASIRSTFEKVPDAPVTKFVLNMRGGKKGLIVNSRNLCAGPGRARVLMTGQNNKLRSLKPVVKTSCTKNRKGKGKGKGKSR